jgi:hypothetical protein
MACCSRICGIFATSSCVPSLSPSQAFDVHILLHFVPCLNIFSFTLLSLPQSSKIWLDTMHHSVHGCSSGAQSLPCKQFETF